MADYATLLRDHVTLTCRSVGRIFLQAYVPKLQSVGGVCEFCTGTRGSGFPRRRRSARSATCTSPRCIGGRRRTGFRCAASPRARSRRRSPSTDRGR
jgi:hypothetical protein